MPKVSVVIPSFRGGWLLRQAISSVQSQVMIDWELIVVLDGCDDDLIDIERADPRVRSLRQPRRGVSIARNVGISHALSDLIAVLDDDDRMLPRRLLVQSAAMDDEAITISHTQFRFIDQEGRHLKDGDSADTTYMDFLRGTSRVLSGSAMFRKRSFLEVGGYNSLLQRGEGQDLFFRIARMGQIHFVPEVLTEYRQHNSNTWLGSSSGSGETSLVLRQHLLAARAGGEADRIRAVRRGLATVPPNRVALALSLGINAWSRHAYLKMVVAFSWVFLLSPIFTLRAVGRKLANRGRR